MCEPCWISSWCQQRSLYVNLVAGSCCWCMCIVATGGGNLWLYCSWWLVWTATRVAPWSVTMDSPVANVQLAHSMANATFATRFIRGLIQRPFLQLRHSHRTFWVTVAYHFFRSSHQCIGLAGRWRTISSRSRRQGRSCTTGSLTVTLYCQRGRYNSFRSLW